uniref:UDP-glucuronate decarboxylase n=1 Tax=Acrobeloides nanus TaxID=290746 RepID=A0A914ECF5_9BILA
MNHRTMRTFSSPFFLVFAGILTILGLLAYTMYKPNSVISPKVVISKDESAALKLEIENLQRQVSHLKRKMGSNLVLEKPKNSYPQIKFQNEENRKRILITGAAGFVGSHLVDKLMMAGHEVIALDNYFTGRRRNVEHWIALDNYFTGRRRNVEHWIGHPNFELVHHDVVNPYYVEVDQIYHLASPASPPHYMYNPVKTIKTNTVEVYGDPEVHPQPETYWGHVNTIGPRSCYDEGKRVAESLMVAYQKQEKVDIRIARIFNTFGPRMHMNDGRVVSNFILQALQGKDITIYGNGNQTRSFQYVSDLVDGLFALMNSNTSLPVNLGNPEEHTITDFAAIIRDLVGSGSQIVNHPKAEDDPQQRKPDIKRAGELLGWQPKISMRDGLKKTIEYFKNELANEKSGERMNEDKKNDKSVNVPE